MKDPRDLKDLTIHDVHPICNIYVVGCMRNIYVFGWGFRPAVQRSRTPSGCPPGLSICVLGQGVRVLCLAICVLG
jgi:hypothetical protein